VVTVQLPITQHRDGELMATSCDKLGKQHRWQERKEKYSPWSSQDVGSYWICLDCYARSEEKPTNLK